MKLIVGLGNPGKKYKNNRHNVGFIILDELAKIWGLAWEYNKKFDAEISSSPTPRNDGGNYNARVILLKPQTFMNNSGTAVSKALEYFGIPLKSLLVIHDDVDLEPLQFKESGNSSSAGHRGVQDIIDKLDSQDFFRLRVGVGRPTIKADGTVQASYDVEKYVLEDFSKIELENVKKQGIEHLLSSLKI